MIQEKKGISFVTFDLFSQAGGVTAAVAGRRGGVSREPFDSLNMSFSTGDEPARIVENRRRFLSVLGLPAERMVSCHQVHGTHIEITKELSAGRGATDRSTAIPECDGLATDVPGLPLTMNFADCTPLLFYDPRQKAIAVAHGGWRGTAGDIGGKTVKAMEENYGSRPEDILAVIGPAIGACCFEVGQDVVDAFAALFSKETLKKLVQPKAATGKFLFDLKEANRLLLLRAGVNPEHVEVSSLCTYCRGDLFYSYRRDHEKAGRHMAVICLSEGRPYGAEAEPSRSGAE